VTVTGKLAAADAVLAADAELAADAGLTGAVLTAAELAAAGELLLTEDPQPARAAAQAAAAPRATADVTGDLKGVLIAVTSSRGGGKEGETVGAPRTRRRSFAMTDHPSHEGR
jgi:hypothetical protein